MGFLLYKLPFVGAFDKYIKFPLLLVILFCWLGIQLPRANERVDIELLPQINSFVLDATALIEDGNADYQWSIIQRPDGSSATITDEQSPIAQVQFDLPGTYIVELLTAVDGVVGTPLQFNLSSDGAGITGAAPTPVIGVGLEDELVSLGRVVRLDAVRSIIPSSSPASYNWSLIEKPQNSSANLELADGLFSNFIPDVEGAYTVSLTVSDIAGAARSTSMTLTVGTSVVLADAGADVSGSVGQSFFLDGFGSTSVGSLPLSQDWSLISQPEGSVATLQKGADLAEPQTGRYVLTPDVDGLYVARLRISDGNSEDVDFVVINAGSPQEANVAPVADAGGDRFSVGGASVALDASGSSDFDGDALSYSWSLVSSPSGSLAALDVASGLQANLLTDLPGDYVVQLAVDDGQRVSHDLLRITNNASLPIAAAGSDSVLTIGGTNNLDASQSSTASSNPLTYAWSVLGLGTPGATDAANIESATDAVTSIDFNRDPGVSVNPAIRFGEYELIVLEDMVSNAQSRRRTFIGGTLSGPSTEFGGTLRRLNPSEVTVAIGGDIIGGPKSVLKGGSIAVAGSVQARLNFQGSGELLENQLIDTASIRRDLQDFSQFLAGLTDTGEIVLPTGNPARVTLVAEPGDNGIAVLSIDNGNDLFNNDLVPHIAIEDNNASAIVINVGGADVDINVANFIDNFTRRSIRRKVIWNFHEATDIFMRLHLAGSMLAPYAKLENRAPIYGAAAVKELDHHAGIGTPGFEANEVFARAPEPIRAAVVQIRATDGDVSDFDTVLLTDANIAPVAAITASSQAVAPGDTITLNATNSSDANDDALIYRWSLLSRPEGSSSTVDGNGAQISVTPDRRGFYVVQLVVSDGALFSEPQTIVLQGENNAPVITSQAIVNATTGVAYSYQVQAADADNDTLNWRLTSAPNGMTIDASSGLISWTPDVAGSFDVVVTVNDRFGGEDEQAFTVSVEQSGNLSPPLLAAIADVTLRPGETISFTLTADDPDSDTISFQAVPLPQGASFNTTTGVFTFTASSTLGVNAITFFATDGTLTSSQSANIEVVANPDGDPTQLSGRVLDASDFANGIETPVTGASVSVGALTVITDVNGRFEFTDIGLSGSAALTAAGANATAADGSAYGNAGEAVFIFENGTNILPDPILLARLGDQPTQLSEVQDNLPPELRSCLVQRVDAQAGGVVPLASLPLQAFDPLVPGTTAIVWARDASATTYQIVGEGTVGTDGLTLENVTGSVNAGSNLVVTSLPLSVQPNDLQPRSRHLPTLLGEGNLQTSFTLPSYQSLANDRAPSFIYNSTTADPRPIITANVELPSNTTLTENIQVEVFVNGQRMPGVGVIDVTQAAVDGTSVPVQGETVTTAISVAFNAAAIPTGVHPYELLVFAGHDCAAAGAKATGDVFINNRSQSPYGAGWKPSEIQTLIPLPDGSVAIEEPDGTISNFEGRQEASIVTEPVLFDVVDPERADIGDIDGDGDLDILVVEGETGDVLIIENLGNGTREFRIRERFDAGSDGRNFSGRANEFSPDTNDVVIGDFNNDGIPDFATAHQFDNVGRVFLGRGDQTFDRIEFNTGRSVSVVSGDFNGDGNLDLAYSQTNDAFIVLGPISSASTTDDINLIGFNINDLDSADLNNDGFDDLISASSTLDRLEIVFGAPDFFSQSPVAINTPGGIQSGGLQQLLSIGDIDGNGTIEIAATGPRDILVYSPDGAGTFQLINRITLPNGGDVESVAIRDIQGDGPAELIAVNRTATVYIYDAGAIFDGEEPTEILIPGSGDDTIVVGDLDADGFQDIALFYASTVAGVADNIAVHFGTGFNTDEFIRPFSDFTDLLRLPDGGFERTYKNGSVVVFNADGLQTSLSDANGNTTSYEYDAEGRVTSITDPVGLATTYIYNADGRLASVTTPDNRTSSFVYDPSGNLITTELPNISIPQSVTLPDGATASLGSDSNSTVPYVQQSFTTGTTSIVWGYDDNGRIVSQVDEREQTSTFEYGAGGRIEVATLPDQGRVEINIARTVGLSEFGVDLSAPADGAFVEPDQRVTRIVDARGFPTEQEVNDFGAVIRKVDQIGREVIFERNGDNLVTRVDAPSSVTENSRLISEFTYDNQGNMLTRTDAVGTPSERSMAYEFEPQFSQVTRLTDYAGFIYTYDYDDRSNRTRRINPDNTEMLYSYDDRGLLLSRTDERGNVMRYEYNDLGLYTAMTDPQGIDTTRTLDASGNPSVVVYANGTNVAQVVVNFFDDENRAIASINGENERFQRTYDRNGNPRTYLDDTGVEGDNLYDEKSRLITKRSPASGDTTYTYDVNDNVTQVVESDGETTTYTYDPVNRMTDSVDGIGDQRRYVYDSRDNVIAVTDARGNTTTYTYDELDRVITRTNQVGNTWRFEYDARDLRVATIKPDGTRIEFTYDSRRRMISYGAVGVPESLRTFSYDEENLLIGAQAAGGTPNEITHSFSYDERDQLSEATLAAGPLGGAFSFAYDYDPLERRSEMRDSAGAVTAYRYDQANRLTSLVLPSGRTVNMAYDAASRRTDVVMPNGMNARVTFSTPQSNGGTTGLLASIAHGLNDLGQPGSQLNQRLGTFSYGFDSKANITNIVEDGSINRTRAYTLDPIERLTNVTDASGAVVENYTLDNEGNRLASHLASFHVTDPANRVTEDENFEFDHDVNGNLIRKTDKTTGVTFRYTYSVYDELIEVVRSVGTTQGAAVEFRLAYIFDALGRRHTERLNDGTGALIRGANFRYDGEHLAHEELLDGSGVVSSTRWYTHSDYTDELISLTLPAGDAGTVSPTATIAGGSAPANEDFYAHVDHQGSLRAFTDSSTNVVNEYSYDSYGQIEADVEAVEQRFRYTGRFYDKDTGLYHYRARAYDPETGRFLQEDPIWFAAGDLNVHRYVWNNPVNWTDPSGLNAVGRAATGALATQLARGGLPKLGLSLRQTFQALAFALAATPGLNSPAGNPSGGNSPSSANGGEGDGVGGGGKNPAAPAGPDAKPGTPAAPDTSPGTASPNPEDPEDDGDDGSENDNLPKPERAVNTRLPHAVDRGVQRGVFKDSVSARQQLRELSRNIAQNKNFPQGSIRDTARPNSVLVPVGNNGFAVFRVGRNGTASLRTVLNAR